MAVSGTSATKRKQNLAEVERSSFWKRIVWVFLVGIVPFIVAVLLIGTALQIIGVPVWQTTKDWLGWTASSHVSLATFQSVQQDLAAESAKERLVSSENATLRQQVNQDEQQIRSLTTQLAALQAGKQSATVNAKAAKQESQVLGQMDPGDAANMLGKMSVQDAASIIAVMTPTDSGPILAHMNPSQASKVLALAAQISSENLTPNAAVNGTDNATGY